MKRYISNGMVPIGRIVLFLLLMLCTSVAPLLAQDMDASQALPLDAQIQLDDGEFARVIVTRVTDYIEGFGVSTPAELELEEGWHHFSQVLENASGTRVPRTDILPEDPALIQFTGGTIDRVIGADHAADDLNEGHDGSGVEEVHSDHRTGPRRRPGDARDRNRRGIREENGFGASRPKLLKQRHL